jgi:hypothetical protein
MTYHPDVRSIRRVSLFVDWLKTLFDPKRYPWFGDDFIHPRDIAKRELPGIASTLMDLPVLKPSRHKIAS